VDATTDNQQTELVTRGLYCWMRHPLYTGGLLFIWFTPLMTRNLLALIVGLTLYLILGAFLEERRLLHEFGEAYAEYRRCVPMLIPLPWKHC
jgi:protein-S-isoprenylcysteine O-methyltransferase Ste14